jgi:hypothetical protein
LKHPTGWFAAGREVASAITLLSDGAFKLYVFLCLRADRSSARLEIDQTSVAKSLAKSRRSVIVYFEELKERGVCEVRFAANQHTRGVVQICDAFWPYETTEPVGDDAKVIKYVKSICGLLESRPCVRCSFVPADDRLARTLFSNNVPFENIERAFLLGCTRKYISWLNGQISAPIASLEYFRSTIDEVEKLETSSEYWRYVRESLDKYEIAWLAKAGKRIESSGTVAG